MSNTLTITRRDAVSTAFAGSPHAFAGSDPTRRGVRGGLMRRVTGYPVAGNSPAACPVTTADVREKSVLVQATTGLNPAFFGTTTVGDSAWSPPDR